MKNHSQENNKNRDRNNQKGSKEDPRKNPRPGYDEKNPTQKEDIQDHPEDQNTG